MRATDIAAAPPSGHRLPVRPKARSAFTLVELLLLVSIIAIIAALLLPGLVVARTKAQSTSCANNFRQLILAWQTYTVDYNDALPANKWRSVDWQDGCPTGYQTTADSWVLGDATVDTSTWNIQNGSLFAYTRNTTLYHCAIDRSVVDLQPQILRKRSYSMSYYMNGSEQKPQRKTKLSTIPKPSRVFVFVEEHQDSIQDGVFFVHVPGDDGEQAEAKVSPTYMGAHWMDLPSDRHGQGCNLSFADGHAEHWKWKWPKRVTSNGDADPVNLLDYQDLRRLQTGIPGQ